MYVRMKPSHKGEQKRKYLFPIPLSNRAWSQTETLSFWTHWAGKFLFNLVSEVIVELCFPLLRTSFFQTTTQSALSLPSNLYLNVTFSMKHFLTFMFKIANPTFDIFYPSSFFVSSVALISITYFTEFCFLHCLYFH